MSWSTGLFDCTLDVKQCIDNMCCFPCSISRQLNAIEDSQPDTFTMSKCIIPGVIPGLLWVGPIFVNCYVRRQIVNKYNIDEGLIGSLLRGFCPCSVCQHHRELTKRNCWPGGSCLHKQPGSYDMA